MGRPLRKDVFGVDVIGTYGTNTPGDASAGMVVKFYDSGLRTDGTIVKQRGAKTFVVARIGDIGTTANYVTAVLKNGTPTAYGEMQLVGYLAGGADASAVNIAKITKRVATDFTGAKYTWRMTNYADSSADQLELTAL